MLGIALGILPGCRQPPGASLSSEYPITHIVEQGETLSTLARKYYGEDKTGWWQHLYKENKQLLGGNIEVSAGQLLVIPAPPDPSKFRYEADFSKI